MTDRRVKDIADDIEDRMAVLASKASLEIKRAARTLADAEFVRPAKVEELRGQLGVAEAREKRLEDYMSRMNQSLENMFMSEIQVRGWLFEAEAEVKNIPGMSRGADDPPPASPLQPLTEYSKPEGDF